MLRGAGLKYVNVSVKEVSSCLSTETADPIGQALNDSLGEGEGLESFVASIYVTGFRGEA